VAADLRDQRGRETSRHGQPADNGNTLRLIQLLPNKPAFTYQRGVAAGPQAAGLVVGVALGQRAVQGLGRGRGRCA